jgi:hypothetical protein
MASSRIRRSPLALCAMSAQAAEQIGYSRSKRALPGASRRIPAPALAIVGGVRLDVRFGRGWPSIRAKLRPNRPLRTNRRVFIRNDGGLLASVQGSARPLG